MSSNKRWKIAASILLLVGCDETGLQLTNDNPPVNEDELTFASFSPALLTQVTRQGSFHAVKGEKRELVLRYEPDEPGEEGDEFLELEIEDDALMTRPDGTPFAEGDSIRITVTVDAQNRFVFFMEPSGLVFDPGEPAELEIDFRRTDPDLNRDGQVDSRDSDFKANLRIWKQEVTGGPWIPLGTVEVDDDRLKAEIDGFTGFALAN